MALTITVKIESIDVEKAEHLIDGDDFGLYMAYQTHRLYKPYVPFATGTLRDSVDYQPWQITHSTPYAHYQWEGKAYGQKIPITQNGFVTGFYSKGTQSPTGKQLKYTNPAASAHWEEKINADDLAKCVTAWIKNH